jgi:hypothetical protein
MSSGTNLHEMEVDVKENAVTAGANPAEPMVKPSGASVEDLGGPTPENYKPDDDSAKLKTPGATLKQVRDVVNKGAKPAEPMPAGMKEEEESEIDDDQEVVSEEEIAEEEITEEEEVVELDIDADVEALLQGEELSEEFQEKAKTIFEAAINAKVAAIQEDLEASYATVIEEQVATFKSEMTERVDSYLEYVSSEWLEENQLTVEDGLKAEMSESFLTGMRTLFEEHYVSIPEDRYDVLESMVNKLDEMEGKLNEQIDRNVALNRRLAESTSDGVLSDVSEGLAVTQKEKLATLAESVEFDSETDYREKLVTLREAYFPSRPSAQRDSSEYIAEEASMNQNVSGSMEGYLTALQRVSKK